MNMVDMARAEDEAAVGAGLTVAERLNWRADWLIEKWHNSASREAGDAPYEVIELPHNGLLNDGINFFLNRLIGGADGTYPAWNNANANIVVGNSAAAFAATQTDVQGASNATKAMDATYPTVAAQTVTFRSTFGASEGNFAWEEIGVKNGAGAISATVKLLNRRVGALGTKVSPAVWTVTLTITVS